MPHPFVSIAAELKVLQQKLNYCTYEAVFGRTIEDRQRGCTDATALRDKIETVFQQAQDSADQVSAFMRGPSKGGLMASVQELIQLVEAADQEPALVGKMMAGSNCTNTPLVPR